MAASEASYLEACPRLPIRDAVAKASQGLAECVWHIDAEPIVSASLSLMDAQHLVIWLGEEVPGAPAAIVRIATAARGLRTRIVGVCPGCGRNAETLVLKGREWKCIRCSHLKRSIAKSRDMSEIAEEIGRIKKQVRLGRVPRKWTSTYVRESDRLANLVKGVGGYPLQTGKRSSSVSGPSWTTNDHQISNVGVDGPSKLRPRYWEAIPSISAIEARKEAREGRRLCIWLEPSGLPVGGAEIDVRGDKVAIRYAFHRRPKVDAASGAVTFQIEYRGSRDDNQRALLKCPVCGHARAALGLLEDLWACRECHRLPYRSALVGSPVRRAEAYAKRLHELTELRNEGRRPTTIEKKKEEVALALKKAGPMPHRVASRDYNFILSREWRDASFDVDGFYDP